MSVPGVSIGSTASYLQEFRCAREDPSLVVTTFSLPGDVSADDVETRWTAVSAPGVDLADPPSVTRRGVVEGRTYFDVYHNPSTAGVVAQRLVVVRWRGRDQYTILLNIVDTLSLARDTVEVSLSEAGVESVAGGALFLTGGSRQRVVNPGVFDGQGEVVPAEASGETVATVPFTIDRLDVFAKGADGQPIVTNAGVLFERVRTEVSGGELTVTVDEIGSVAVLDSDHGTVESFGEGAALEILAGDSIRRTVTGNNVAVVLSAPASGYSAASASAGNDDDDEGSGGGEGSGTVTSVAITGANGISVSGSPITDAGTIALSVDAATLRAHLDVLTSGQIATTLEDYVTATGLSTTLEDYALASSVPTEPGDIGAAAAAHSHVIADVTGLQTALDGKAASSHIHSIANVTGLQAALDGRLVAASNLSDLASASTARANLGAIGTASDSPDTITGISGVHTQSEYLLLTPLPGVLYLVEEEA